MPCVGFQRCPSRRLGQCESLELWDGQRRIPRFIFIEVLHKCRNTVGDWGSIRIFKDRTEMYKITWDKETGGVQLHSRIVEGTLGVSPRPVFFEELDLLGLDK